MDRLRLIPHHDEQPGYKNVNHRDGDQNIDKHNEKGQQKLDLK